MRNPSLEVVPDAGTMREFIAWWFEYCTAGLLELGWIDARTGGLTAFAQFELGGSGIDQLVATAVQANLVEGQSVYFRAATVRAWGRGVGRTGDGDFVQAPGPWGDSDTAADLERARSVVSMLRPNGQTVTGTVPHLRVQSWWRCDAPICDGGAVRALNGRVVRLFGGDGAVVNPSRLMRLAGSIAWPRKEGRIAEVTRFVRPGAGEGRPGAYRLALLHAQLPAEGAGVAGVSPGVSAPIQAPVQAAGVGTVSQLLGAIRSGRGWHDSVVRLVAHWVGRGWSTAEIMAAGDSFTLPGWTVEQTRAEVGKAIEGARGKWSVPDVDAPLEGGGGSSPADASILDTVRFLGTVTRPDYLIDGILQRGRLYALCSPTGHGKTAVALYLACMLAIGRAIGGIDVVQGNVLILAGENPDDLCVRMHAACQAYGILPAALPIWILPGNFPMDAAAAEKLRARIDALGVPGGFSLIVGDSAAAYFGGADENDNVQMGAYARAWRVLTGCVGRPAVLSLAHPFKAAGRDQLLPRGGGAFLAELDANLTLWAEGDRETTTLHWQGKIRGADFAPVAFRLEPVRLEKLADTRGRALMSVVAQLQTAEEAAQAARATITDENVVLEWLRRHPGVSIRDIALNAGWVSEAGKPHIGKVQRLLHSLKELKLARKWRDKWQITDLGKAELKGGDGL